MDTILDAESQAAIADSIIGDDSNIVGNWNVPGSLAEGEEQADPFEPVPPGADESLLGDVDQYQQQAEQGEAREQQFAPEAQQVPQELTPEQIQQDDADLQAFIQSNGLNDPQLAKPEADDFYAAFGAQAFGSVNYEQWGRMNAETTLRAANIYEQVGGDPSKVPANALNPTACMALWKDFHKANGIDDPRRVPGNPQLFAQTMFQFKWNAYDAYRRGMTDVQQINDPNVTVQGVDSFLRSLAVPEAEIAKIPVDVKLRVGDTAMRHELARLTKYGQIQPQQQPKASRSRRGSQSRFKTNADLYDEDTMSQWDREHAVGKRSSASQEFAPKPKAQRSRFQTNQDIFSEDVLSDMYNRL